MPLISLWEKRSLILYFSILNLKLRFKGTYLGLLWAAIEPLIIFSILYTVIITIRSVEKEDFAIYLIVGVLFYHLFSRGTISGMNSIVQNGSILKSLNVQKEIFPVISTGTVCIFMLVQMVDLFALMPIFDFVPSWTILFLIPLLILFLVLILGVSYFLSVLYVYVRDVQQIWGILIYALLFVSPIFWYVNDVDGILLHIQHVNPLGQIIELAHKIVVFGEIPAVVEWLYVLGIVLGIFFAGYAVFKKYEARMVEKL